MATCGYLCPACEGRGYDEEGKNCNWCAPSKHSQDNLKDTGISKEEKQQELKEWIAKVHQGPCCGDL